MSFQVSWNPQSVCDIYSFNIWHRIHETDSVKQVLISKLVNMEARNTSASVCVINHVRWQSKSLLKQREVGFRASHLIHKSTKHSHTHTSRWTANHSRILSTFNHKSSILPFKIFPVDEAEKHSAYMVGEGPGVWTPQLVGYQSHLWLTPLLPSSNSIVA